LYVVNLLCALMTIKRTKDDAVRGCNIEKLEVMTINIRTAMHTASLAVVQQKRPMAVNAWGMTSRKNILLGKLR